MEDPATAPWGLHISNADLQKLQAGFEPQDHDNKWRVSVSDQGQSSEISVHIARSAFREELFVLTVKLSDVDGENGSAQVEAITWQQDQGGVRISEEIAKKQVTLLVRRVLGGHFEKLPEYSFEEAFLHPARKGAR